ncbi:hypothetical protein QFC24_004461 [Naganishia onofrii]|uniref:Uncharacterized protein n=1 Tax=Naganishia onofrii TaxID=1851511 RepID=A0ACC2XEN4_9TREE|nr:hypothetical protein QFC24_004461 [Naganishia onofrii]
MASTAMLKRARVDDEGEGAGGDRRQVMAISAEGKDQGGMGSRAVVMREVKRTSGLEAPIVSLAGAHQGEIISCKFDQTGERIAAGSADRCISLWKTYPPHDNYGFLPNVHKQAITDIAFSPSNASVIYSVGADGMLIATVLSTSERLVRYAAHYGPVNSLAVTRAGTSAGRELLLTGGDDGVARVWDPAREGKDPVVELDDGLGGVVTAVEWSADGSAAFVGGVDNEIKVWDLRKQEVLYTLRGHTDTIASLALSPNGHFLLSFAFDSTCIIHDVRPFSADPTRVHRTLIGAPAGFEQSLTKCAWSKTDNGARVAAGGGDRTVTIWDVDSGKILYKLGGHKGSVGAVDFHPREPIILTGSKDTNMLLGEIDAQDLN